MGRLGLITIGQSPRQDIVQDMLPILGSSQELLQRGALDNLTATQLQNLAPNLGEQVLVSSLQDGTSVVMAETKVVNLLQDCIQELEQKGAQCILLDVYKRQHHGTRQHRNDAELLRPRYFPFRTGGNGTAASSGTDQRLSLIHI